MSIHTQLGSFRLWSDEIEAMRGDARAAVEAGRDSMYLSERPSAGLSRDEHIAAQREMMARVTFPVPEAEERAIGGVPCRVHRPDNAPRAVYLHFHGGGMVCGSAAMMDIPNQMIGARARHRGRVGRLPQSARVPVAGGPRRRRGGRTRAARDRGVRVRDRPDPHRR